MPKNRKQDTVMKSHIYKKDNHKKPVLGQRGVSTIDIIIIIVAGIVIIVSGIFLYSNFKTLKRVNEEIADVKELISDKQDTLNKLIELGQSEDALKENYERNMLYVPETKNEVGIIADVTGIVENEGGNFRTITYSQEVIMENNVTDIPFTIRIDSTYEQLNEIVDKLGRTNRLYVIDSVTIIETGTNKEILSTEIEMHAYYKMQ